MRRLSIAFAGIAVAVSVGCSQSEPSGLSPVSPSSMAMAAKAPKNDIPVSVVIDAVDANGLPADTTSDGAGAYLHGVGGVSSLLVANAYNGLTNGDWQFSAQTTRKVGVRFDPADAVQPGDPAYLVPAAPPFWGTQVVPVVLKVKCTFVSHSMLAMANGETFACPLLNELFVDDVQYGRQAARSFTGFPETTDVQITCNAADTAGCSSWVIDPIAHGRAIARLVRPDRRGTTHLGDVYLRFKIRITRP